MQLTFALEPPADRPAGVVVPLTPLALDGCRQAGIEHLLLDDLVDRPALIGATDGYLRWQLDWMTTFGEVAGAPDACRTAAQLLKTPIDSAVVWARVLRAAVVAFQPTSVSYLGPFGPEEENPFHHGHLQFWPILGDLPLAARFLPLVARTLSLPFEVQATAHPGPVPGEPPHRSPTASFKARAAPLRHLSLRRLERQGQPRATLFTWTGGYGLRSIARAERAAGTRVLFLRRGGPATAVLRLGPLGYGPVGAPLPHGRTPPRSSLPSDAEALLREIDEQAGLEGAAEALRRRLETQASSVLPLIERLATGLEPQLESSETDRVVSTNAWSVEEFAALLAARRLGIERVLYQHGDHAFSYDGWVLTETHNFDRMIATDPTVPPDLADGGRRLHVPTPTVSLGRHRVPPARTSQPDNAPVCYVPIALSGDTSVLPRAYMEDAWYLRWQLRLLAEMSNRTGTQFLWKALPGSDQAEDPIPSILRREGTVNVRYETRPFLEVLPDVSRVVLDFPSTALYEAVWAGVPTVCVSFPRFAVLRARALALFGGIVHPCEDEDAALASVRRFLDTSEQDAITAVRSAGQRLAGPSPS